MSKLRKSLKQMKKDLDERFHEVEDMLDLAVEAGKWYAGQAYKYKFGEHDYPDPFPRFQQGRSQPPALEPIPKPKGDPSIIINNRDPLHPAPNRPRPKRDREILPWGYGPPGRTPFYPRKKQKGWVRDPFWWKQYLPKPKGPKPRYRLAGKGYYRSNWYIGKRKRKTSKWWKNKKKLKRRNKSFYY
jgi:hypothetical protein